MSPQRRTRHDSDNDMSPPRRNRHDSDNDMSPQRRTRHDSDNDMSPPRRNRHDSDNDMSPQRRTRHDSDNDMSPPRRTRHDSDNGESKHNASSSLKKYNSETANTIVRDHTGKKIDVADSRSKADIADERHDKVKLISYGMKQLQEKRDKIDLLEKMKSAKFSRYADDVELNQKLKEKTHWDDPSRTWLKSTNKKVIKQEYQGPFPPNRFNIKPGHKWDGIDRSNGFEKKYFDQLYINKTREHEAYKMGSVDM
ncbi:hypothetical protein ROZALSC1DRAFT_13350 [Rozella allomycis CSF55]|uniref:Pre-mRNA-splicing factor CWC26 n=1 Tax=Rozella allomycis (strain CSF55) TaxID=988480 RepID=A0A4P9YKD8_ROZAC|nr:hypothetical protein ROZALSC1DRAFT_13350 [Rozella allomycis CSF55]